MGCNCGKPKCDGNCGVSPAVLQVNNNECTLFRKVEVPASMGDETVNPPEAGEYRNVLLYYEASGNSYLYSSDGMPTKLTGVVNDYEVLLNKPWINGVELIGHKTLADLGITTAINNAVAAEATIRSNADTALQNNINAEANIRSNADTALQNNINAEANTRSGADTTLQNNITAEQNARINADTALQNNINTLTTSQNSLVSQVNANTSGLSSEITNRTNADTALQNQITTLANSAITADDINYTVTTGSSASSNSSTASITDSKVNLKTGNTSSTTYALPVASSTKAGVMNSATYAAVTSNTNNINAILNGAVAITGLPAAPSQSALTTAWQTETGLTTLINRASIYDVTNGKVWTYYTNDATWHATTSASTITINTFTNNSEGTIKGSTADGQVYAESDGTGSVNGWDTLTNDVSTLQSQVAGITVNNATLTIQKNGTNVQTFTANSSTNKTANIIVPTKTSELENDSDFVSATDTTQCEQGAFISTTNPNSSPAPLSSVELLGNTTQDTLSGKNLYDVSTLGTGTYTTVDSNGWITMNRDNSAGSSTVYLNAWTSNLTHLATSTRYDVFMEVKSVSGDGGELAVTSTASGSGQFDSWQVFQITSLSAGTVYVRNPTTKSSFSGISNGLRTTLTLPAGKKCSITFRLSVLAYGTETSSTFSYEPYCGGIPAPNPTYPIDVQTTTGEQVVEIMGKNVYDATTAQTTSQGLTYSGDTGYIYLNGTRTGDGGINWANGYLPAGKYKLMLELVSGSITSTSNGQLFFVYGANITFSPSQLALSSNNPKGSITLTVSADTTNAHINSWARRTETCTNAVIKYQIVRGEDDDYDFEPYQSQSYEVNLGKNLFDVSATPWVSGVAFNSSGDLASWSGYYGIAEYQPVQPNTTYTFSNSTNKAIYYGLVYYDTNKTKLSNIATSTTTFTTPANCHFIRFAINNGSAPTWTQLELGSTATDYAAYFTPIELCKLGDYQDKIYKSGDDWYVRKEVGKYNLATATWTIEHTANSYRFQMPAINDILPTTNQQVGKIMSNGYKPATASQSWAYTSGFCIAQQNDKKIIIYDERYNQSTSQSGFRTWIANSTMVLYYALATATDTQITNQALIDQLEALASSTLFVGVNNIALVPSGGAQGELSLCFYQSTLPVATDKRLGAVIVGDGLNVSSTGVISTDPYYTKTESDAAFVPQTRTVNSKPLSSNIALTASDVGALPDSTVIPTVNNATLTIQKNGTTVKTFTANASSNVTANITVPTKTSDITNDSNFVTSTSLSAVATSGAYSDLSGTPTVPVITLTTTDPGEGSSLAANHFIGVYQ